MGLFYTRNRALGIRIKYGFLLDSFSKITYINNSATFRGGLVASGATEGRKTL